MDTVTDEVVDIVANDDTQEKELAAGCSDSQGAFKRQKTDNLQEETSSKTENMMQISQTYSPQQINA